MLHIEGGPPRPLASTLGGIVEALSMPRRANAVPPFQSATLETIASPTRLRVVVIRPPAARLRDQPDLNLIFHLLRMASPARPSYVSKYSRLSAHRPSLRRVCPVVLIARRVPNGCRGTRAIR